MTLEALLGQSGGGGGGGGQISFNLAFIVLN